MTDFMITTEREAWEAIADTLEMIEGMPPWGYGSVVNADGLCAVVAMMQRDQIINQKLYCSMTLRLGRALRRKRWLAPQGLYQPRIIIARKFAEDSND